MTQDQPVHKLDVIREDAETIHDLENDMETDVLIKWTEALDFEKYYDDWTRLATSGPNEPVHLRSIPQTVVKLTSGAADKETERSFTPYTQVSLCDLILK